MADSDDESSAAAEDWHTAAGDWHHEFDDYNGEHSQDARDLAYRRIEPLLGDATYPADTMYECFGDPAPDAWGWVGYTGRDMFAEATTVRIAAVEAACFASGWQFTCFDGRDRCLRAVVDVMLYDPVEAVREAAADGLRYTHGGLWLRKLDYGQPMLDLFLVAGGGPNQRSKGRRV